MVSFLLNKIMYKRSFGEVNSVAYNKYSLLRHRNCL